MTARDRQRAHDRAFPIAAKMRKNLATYQRQHQLSQPGLQQELETLRTRVKQLEDPTARDLEMLTRGAERFAAATAPLVAEQAAELRQRAAQRGADALAAQLRAGGALVTTKEVRRDPEGMISHVVEYQGLPKAAES